MKAIVDYFTSDTFGFLLKLLTGVAAAVFGLLAIGTKVRDRYGKLNKNGRIVLRGIIMAGVLTVTTSVYDFVKVRQKAKEDQVRDNTLLTSVQRGNYPFREVHVSFDLVFKPRARFADFFGKEIMAAFAAEPHCAGMSYDCLDANNYRVRPSSPLFPKAATPSAPVETALQYPALRFILMNQFELKGSPDGHQYSEIGYFSFSLDSPTQFESLIWNSRLHQLTIHVEDYRDIKVVNEDANTALLQGSRGTKRTARTRALSRAKTRSCAHISADTIHCIVIRFLTLPINTEFACSTNAGRRDRRSLGRLSHRARGKQDQILKAATIQRHIFHVGLIHHRADRRIRCIDHRRAAFNRHGVENGPYRQGKVDRQRVLDVENNIGLDECLESHLGNGSRAVTQ
jgi:hypothetical protein